MIKIFNFSPAQEDAICSRGENLLVSAGAGSGKTTVLVERILRYIANGGNIEQVLALTFTSEAAADMREKLDRAISALVARQPHDRHLQEQLILLPQAQISTIHSFCLNLLRRNYYRIGLDAGFRVAGEAEIELLEHEVLLQYLEEAYADESSGITALADAYGGARDDSALLEIMLELHQFCRSRPQPLAWLAEACGVFASQELSGYPFAADIMARVQRELAAVLRLYQRLLPEASQLDDKWQAVLGGEQASVAAITQEKELSLLLDSLAKVSFGRLPALKTDDKQRCEYIRQGREQAKEIIRNLQRKYCAAPINQQLAELHSLAPLMTTLYQVMAGFESALAAEKRRRGWVDLADMEHLTLALLEDESFSVELAQEYQEILIDEYQDINEIQEAILRRICGRDNLFAVGDVKQSIYRFRLAEPQLFLDKYNNYGSSLGGRRIDLNYNYRSETAVIDGVNFIFGQLMRADIAEIEYDDDAQLHTEKTAPSPAPEFWLIDMDDTGTPAAAAKEGTPDAKADLPADKDMSFSNKVDSPIAQEESVTAKEEQAAAKDGLPSATADAPTALEAEARLIAGRIQELHAEGYAYREMAVLLRASRSREPVIVAELKRAGIPALSEGYQGYLESPEIALMLSALRIIDNPHQDIALAAVLRSPLADFTADELAEIRFCSKEGDLYAALQQAAASDAQPLAAKCQAFSQRLEQWRALAGSSNVSTLINTLYRENGYYQLVGAMSDGAVRQANLRLLLQEAYDYEHHDYAGLFRFISYLNQVEEKKLRSAAACLTGGREDAVRVMSIHRSKGLEFPVVFVAGLGGRFNFVSERGDIIWERDAGLGPVIADRKARRKYPSLAHTAVADRLRELSLAEEIRIYYVAFTRARERLILSAANRGMAAKMTQWAQAFTAAEDRLDAHYVLNATSPLSWLGAALLRHPDAAAWRELAGMDNKNLLPAAAHWQLHYLPLHELPQAQEPALAAAITCQPAGRVSPQIAAALAYRYPFAGIASAPVKWTVTALSRLGIDDELSAKPIYAQETPADGSQVSDYALRGTAYHSFLEKLDFAHADSEAAVAEQLARLTAGGLLDPLQAELIEPARIARFLAGSLGQRLRASQRMLREQEFTFLAPTAGGEQILVQGMLDLAFWENDGWVLIDYKTGGYGKDDEQLRQLYGPQLAYYRQAMERLVGGPVHQSWLVMLDLERVIAG